MDKKIVVGLGEILWDIFPERKVLGGAPANYAYHVSQFGFEGYAVSAIGRDALGQEILLNLEKKKLNYLIESVPFPTGSVKVTLSGAGIPQYEICENAAWDNIPFSERTLELAKKTQVVCFGSLAQRSEVSRNSIISFVKAMHADSLKIFDINMRLNYFTREIIENSLELANVMKLNDDEVFRIAELFGWEGNEQQVCKRLLDEYQLHIVILTKGANGSYIFTPEKTSFLPTPRVHIADTVGAGDSFTAAFTAGYLNGLGIEESHQLATEVAAYVCQQHGAMHPLADAFVELFKK